MANNYSKIKELANKNNMGLSNTIKRDYGIPLDYSSVQESYEAALAYAQTSTLAYIGQPISVGDTLYIVTGETGENALKEVGSKPSGDDKSIVVADDGTISISGFTAAAGATLPRKTTEGNIEWVAIDAIVSGDGNEKTRVVAAEGSDITITPTHDSKTDTYTYTLDVKLPAIPEYTVAKEAGTDKVTYQLTKDGTAIGEAIEVPNAYDDTGLAKRVTDAEAAITEHDSRLDSIEGHVNTFFAAVENPDDVVNTLAEIVSYIEDDKTGAEGMLTSIGENTAAIATLTGDGAGSVNKTVDDAISAQAAIDDAKYATQEALAAVSTVANNAAKATDVETALEDKADKTDLDNYHTKEQSYSKDQVDTLLAGIKGEYGETADSVAGALEAHEAEVANKFAALEAKDKAHDSAIQANTDAITSINDATTGILAKAKAAAATDAQSKVDALANGAVKDNTSSISTINSQISGINNNITTISGNVGTLQGNVATLTSNIEGEVTAREALAGTVGDNTAAIKLLQDKDTELGSLISANTAKFDNYSTTTQVNKAIDDKIAAIDNTALTEAIAANTKAIGDEVTRADTEEKRLAGLIGTNASNISALEATINAVIDDKDGTTLNSIKDLAAWVSEHETEVLPSIEANTNAITTLNGEGDGSVKKTVADAIAGIPMATAVKAGLVKASSEIAVDADGVMSINSVSTDKLVQGSKVLVLNGGDAEVATAE